MNSSTLAEHLPARCKRPPLLGLLAYLILVWFLVLSFEGAGISFDQFLAGIPDMYRLLGEMFPPDFSRMSSISLAIVETLQMALVGTVLGVVISFPLAALASKTTSPHAIAYHISRALISFCRTVPDLVWALFFVATVGLGPFAGTLTLMVDTIGFCGRFFAEGMEEIDRGSSEALRAMGAGNAGILFSAVVPATMPSFINSSLFSLEKAVRSSVVLGLVGAGGIGIELKVAMDMFRYAEAAAIILCIFLLVIIVERLSSTIRSRVL